MAITSKIIIWNEVLRELGDHPLADTTTVTATQKVLNDSWDHAVEYVLSRRDWNFARRRATLTGTTDTTYPPYTRRYARPTDYLRKVWLKAHADDEFQLPHAEVAAIIYGFELTAQLEYVTDAATVYDPVNWPPQFTRVLVLYLAMLCSPKIGRQGMGEAQVWHQKIGAALQEAERLEAVTTLNVAIDTARNPVIRRAIEVLGQRLDGHGGVRSDVDALRWQINRGWVGFVSAVLEQAPWNFALRRATMTSSASTAFPPYSYRFERPADFLKRVWIREVATDAHEADYAEAGGAFYAFAGTKVIEYISADAAALCPTNWPASFSELVAVYIAAQLAPAGTISSDDQGRPQRSAGPRDGLLQQFAAMLEPARLAEASQHQTKQVPAARRAVFRRAFELMGQQLAGFVATSDLVSRLSWQMNLAWDHSVKSVLALGAWNFATKRALLLNGATGDTNVPTDTILGLGEGYSVAPDGTAVATPTPISGYDYSFALPSDFVHKIWLKASAHHDQECPHQFMGNFVFLDQATAIMEYIANNALTADPANWPPLFLDAVAAHLAQSVAPELAVEIGGGKGGRIVASQMPAKLELMFRGKLSEAKNKDAMQQYPALLPAGSFLRARMGGAYGRRLN